MEVNESLVLAGITKVIRSILKCTPIKWAILAAKYFFDSAKRGGERHRSACTRTTDNIQTVGKHRFDKAENVTPARVCRRSPRNSIYKRSGRSLQQLIL